LSARRLGRGHGFRDAGCARGPAALSFANQSPGFESAMFLKLNFEIKK
jgi:hypothetical protein